MKATKTSSIGSVLGHMLRVVPTSALPGSYVAACRELVGMRIRERAMALLVTGKTGGGYRQQKDEEEQAKKYLSSSSSSGSSSSSSSSSGRRQQQQQLQQQHLHLLQQRRRLRVCWRSAVVVDFDERSGAHLLLYDADNTLKVTAEGGHTSGGGKGSHKDKKGNHSSSSSNSSSHRRRRRSSSSTVRCHHLSRSAYLCKGESELGGEERRCHYGGFATHQRSGGGTAL